MSHQSYTVKNVKVHVILPHPITIPKHLNHVSKHHSNFTVVRVGGFVFIIFPNSGCVNISSIKNFDNIKDAINVFNHHFSTNIQREHIVVDNSTASGQLSGEGIIQLFKLIQSPIVDSARLTVSIRPHYFPSATIRGKPIQVQPKRKQKCRSDFATCIIFSNRKFIIVGGKSINHIDNTFSILSNLVKHL